MIKEIEILHSVISLLNLQLSDLNKDSECEEYSGYNFKLNQFSIKFRKAKVTPKKTGQFVTLWKRNPETKETEPFTDQDSFDFYIIITEYKNQSGFFFFRKDILAKKNIITSSLKTGKRGFRIYPDWDLPENKQAISTQKWQTQFFINLSDKENDIIPKLNKILITNNLH
ncbi:MepB family protein [Chryseobacterium sp. JUb7]|uniref:MepB family protein n=1 Tax=Chryseobacterium sp. JUb7 TaxID=2940599 RepID=UPI0021682ACF|nr:MepB family protein [Chryseobacterium sp. JUb7]MCS3532113.1 hypothetical protein [Chryseobacterium sp. JUb7]